MFAHRRQAIRRQRGIALLDALLAVFVFALAVTGLATWLRQIGENSNQLAMDRLVQHGLSGILAEARQRPYADMRFEFRDDLLDVVYRTEIEPVALTTTDGDTLEDMYLLKATAEYAEGSLELTRSAEVYLYKPQEGGR
jgi:type II secretory pathway component PulK